MNMNCDALRTQTSARMTGLAGLPLPGRFVDFLWNNRVKAAAEVASTPLPAAADAGNDFEPLEATVFGTATVS
jgi:hypothetical protein